jgi:hypothetical protein
LSGFEAIPSLFSYFWFDAQDFRHNGTSPDEGSVGSAFIGSLLIELRKKQVSSLCWRQSWTKQLRANGLL